jgi:hypothetical protein
MRLISEGGKYHIPPKSSTKQETQEKSELDPSKLPFDLGGGHGLVLGDMCSRASQFGYDMGLVLGPSGYACKSPLREEEGEA